MGRTRARRPCLSAIMRERAFPSSVLGPRFFGRVKVSAEAAGSEMDRTASGLGVAVVARATSGMTALPERWTRNILLEVDEMRQCPGKKARGGRVVAKRRGPVPPETSPASWFDSVHAIQGRAVAQFMADDEQRHADRARARADEPHALGL